MNFSRVVLPRCVTRIFLEKYVVSVKHQLVKELFLAAKVVIEDGLCDAGLLADFPRGGRGKPFLSKQLDGGVANRLARRACRCWLGSLFSHTYR